MDTPGFLRLLNGVALHGGGSGCHEHCHVSIHLRTRYRWWLLCYSSLKCTPGMLMRCKWRRFVWIVHSRICSKMAFDMKMWTFSWIFHSASTGLDFALKSLYLGSKGQGWVFTLRYYKDARYKTTDSLCFTTFYEQILNKVDIQYSFPLDFSTSCHCISKYTSLFDWDFMEWILTLTKYSIIWQSVEIISLNIWNVWVHNSTTLL